MTTIRQPNALNSTTLPFRANKYVYAFNDAFNGSIGEGEDGSLEIDEELSDKANDLFNIEAEKMCEEFQEFLDEFPENFSPYALFSDVDNALRFMEEGYDLLQALCQTLMMGSIITGISHDTAVAATTLKCLSRDKGFYTHEAC